MKRVFAFKRFIVIGIELVVFLVYAIYSIGSYSKEEISFTSDDMELLKTHGYEGGG